MLYLFLSAFFIHLYLFLCINHDLETSNLLSIKLLRDNEKVGGTPDILVINTFKDRVDGNDP